MIEPGVVVSDRYRILRAIGEGGMGTVFEAEHTGVGRKVAVKVLHADVAGTHAILERFQLEARSAAAIGHDNIIDVLDFGIHDQSPFMVMEFLKGESLSERLTRIGHLEVGHATYILNQVLSALDAAHAVGIVHRDLKPDNVFLVQKAGFPDFVKLLDFGIAKLKSDDDGGASKSMTQTGAVLGTPHYMAPEQALAKRDLDRRVDVYAAGAMLYEMLTGVVPFDAPSEAELLMEIAYRMHPIVAPSAIVATVPAAMDAIVTKAMEKERAARFQTATEFAEAIAPFVQSPTAAAIADGTSRLKVVLRPTDATSSGNAVTSIGQGVPAMTGDFSPAPRARSPMLAIGIVSALVVAGGIAAFAFMHRSTGTTPVTASRPAPAVAPPPPSTAIADPEAHIDLENVPDDAVVTLDDQPESGRHLALHRGSQHTLRVRAPGREDFTSTFNADRDRSIVIAMAARAEPPPPANNNGGTPTVVAPSQHPSASHGAHAAQSGDHPTTHESGRSHSITNPLPVSTEY